MRFPLIPCKLCGSQPNLQRNAIKQMLAAWEREHPGRVQSIFSALQHVEPGTLADPGQFDFAALAALAPALAAAAQFNSDAEDDESLAQPTP
jgi:tRNA 2-thiocytidine biosynthesis protein TtcA